VITINTCCFCCGYCVSLNDEDKLVDYFDGFCLFLRTYVRYEWECELGQTMNSFVGG
jgi:hypothetical protein